MVARSSTNPNGSIWGRREGSTAAYRVKPAFYTLVVAPASERAERPEARKCDKALLSLTDCERASPANRTSSIAAVLHEKYDGQSWFLETQSHFEIRVPPVEEGKIVSVRF